MWLFVPEPSSPSARDTVDSSAESLSLTPAFDLWLLSSGKPTRLQSSQVEWSKVPWMHVLSGTIWNPSSANRSADAWISSLRDSLARAPASPASDEESKTSDGSGLRSGGSRSSSEPPSSSSRTSPGSSPLTEEPHSRRSSGTWARAGGLRNGTVSPRDPAVPRTSAIVSSCSLPTPSASQYGSSQNGINGVGGENERPSAGRPSLMTAAREGSLTLTTRGSAALPTPTTNPTAPNSGSNQVNGPTSLAEAARMLPTPTSTEFKRANEDAERAGVRGGRRLAAEAAEMLPTPLTTSGRQRGSRTNTKSGRTLTEATGAMLPTPTTRPNNQRASRGDDPEGKGLTLADHATMLPTPTTHATSLGRNPTEDRPAGQTSLADRARMLPTPTARDSKGPTNEARNSPTLPDVMKKLPTPRASDATKGARSIPEREGNQGPTLVEEINRLQARGMLPSPTSADCKASGVAGNWTAASGRNSGATLTDVVVRKLDNPTLTGRELRDENDRDKNELAARANRSAGSSNSGESTGSGGGLLSPCFVAWMMGLPTGWESTIPPTPTSSTSSATASYRKRRPSPSSSSGSASTQLSLMNTEPPKTENTDDDA